MALFKFKKTKDQHAIALDIGTEFVKALICRVEDDKAQVIGTGRQRQRLSDMQGGRVTDISGVIENCEKALEQAFDEAGVMPKQCVIGIAGELVKGATTSVHYRRPDPKAKITPKELSDIIAQVQKKSFEKTRSELVWETGYSEIDVKLVNSAVVDVKIDGYKVTNPIGFQGRDIQVGIFDAFAPIVHFGALQTIAEDLGLDVLSIAAEPYAVARCVGLEDSTEFSAIFVDIGGGTTDIAVVRGGGLEGTKMFAIGGRVFTKSIASALDVSFSEAEQLKLAYSKGELDDKEGVEGGGGKAEEAESGEWKAKKLTIADEATAGDAEEIKRKIKKAIENDCEVWLSGVELALEEFSNVELLPNRILLCGGGSLLPEIKKYLEKTAWTKNLPFSRPPKVDFIKPDQVSSVVDTTNKLVDSQDITPMALANLAVGLAGEPTAIEGILDKIVDGLRS